MQLIRFDRARQALAEAVSIDEVKDIRDKAEAVRVYQKQAGESLQMQNQCAEIKIRAERRGGELLAEMEKATGNQHTARSHDGTKQPTLSDLDLTKNQSSRWQQIASIPEVDFEEFIAGTMLSDKELTTSGTLKLARQLKNKAAHNNNGQSFDGCTAQDLNELIDVGKEFATVYADPPWRYGNQGTRAATNNHYETMSVEAICELPIEQLAGDNAQLHLWTTNGFLQEALTRVIPAWGFEYRSLFVWCKPQMGLGNYWRVSHEILLCGVRGNAAFIDNSLKSWAVIDRGRHSSKPNAVREMVERAGNGPRLELFGREARPGWTVWGNEISRQKFLQGS